MRRTENELDSRQVLSVIEKYNTALELFGKEKDDSFKGCIGNIYQSFGGQDIYESMEEKAAKLFLDGQKLIEDYTLAALTIMIAESKPEEKEMMISVIMNCLGQTA